MFSNPGTTPTPEDLADRQAILDILHSHSRGLDRGDLSLLKACYWPEAEVDYGNFKGPAHQFAELVLPALQGQYELTRHCLSNTLFNFSGNRCHTESCVNAGHLLQGAGTEMLFCGRYLDTLEKRDQHWKLVYRQVVMDWSRKHSLEDERGGEAFSALAKGSCDNRDPSYSKETDTP